MTAWKKHNVNRYYVSTMQNKTTSRYENTRGIRLIRIAVAARAKKTTECGYEVDTLVINDTVFLKLEKVNFNRFAHSIKFDGGFLPFWRIKQVNMV